MEAIDTEIRALFEEGVLAIKPASEATEEDKLLPALLLLNA